MSTTDLQTEWDGHSIKVTGDWTWRWLYLTPTYTLWIDDDVVERVSGPRLRPQLEAIVEREGEDPTHITAELLSIVGYRPECEIRLDGEPIESGRIRVQNVLNPFLILFILAATGVMLWVGPDVLRQYLGEF